MISLMKYSEDVWVIGDDEFAGDSVFAGLDDLEQLSDLITAALQDHDIETSNYLKTKGELQ